MIAQDSSSEWSDYPSTIRKQGVLFQDQVIGLPGAGISFLMYVRRDVFEVSEMHPLRGSWAQASGFHLIKRRN